MAVREPCAAAGLQPQQLYADVSVSSRCEDPLDSSVPCSNLSLPFGIGRLTPTDIAGSRHMIYMKVSEQIRSRRADKELGTPEGGDRTSKAKAKPQCGGDGDEGVGSRDRGLEPSSPDSRLLLAHAVGLARASLGGGGAPAAQPPAAAGEVRVPPRQERGVRGLQVPGPHSGVRRAGQLPTPFLLSSWNKASAAAAAAAVSLRSLGFVS